MKPSIPKGTRDFSPLETARRNYIFGTIRSVFSLYGYEPIETPSMENLSVLMGKYGEEGDKLLFKILNSGDFLKGVDPKDLEEKNLNKLASELCEKGLRYDLTVPFARYVVMHRNDLQLPFKRYQIQPVWRADRPQKGRYREFYQCDVDVVGSDSLFNEVELLQILDTVYSRLGIRVAIKLNNRKVLSGIAEVIGESDKLVDITVAIDKVDKIGVENVEEELRSKGLSEDAIAGLRPLFTLSGSNEEKLAALDEWLASSETGKKGVEELRTVVSLFDACGHDNAVEIDVSLARGLNYYTGTIIEVKALDAAIGSISGGGRYDNLTGVFGMPGISGVGVSFGADRIYDVLLALDLFPAEVGNATKVLFLNMGDKEGVQALKYVKHLHDEGVSAMLYPDKAKLKKQMTYANQKAIPYVVVIGEEELANGTASLKNMQTGEQQTLPGDQLLALLKP